ncbi:hypothetical protein ACFXPS_44030 [Nocardia sp. NPDC059091]|uniref:hypothetical protein n=1 Tax=unclassified Nocardia TaxID=2637762 RepID=UPI0036C27C9B
MVMQKSDPGSPGVDALAAATTGVLAWRTTTGLGACTVTPLLTSKGKPVVTSTPAMIGKMLRIAADPRVALAASGTLVQADATLLIDRDGSVFARELLAQEAEKFPPTRSLRAIPGHRRWLAWYFGRVIATLTPTRIVHDIGPDHTVLVTLRDDRPWITSLPDSADLIDVQPGERVRLPVPASGDGPALVLVHKENRAMTALAQYRIHGQMLDGVLEVERRGGSLRLTPPSLFTQLRELRAMAHRAAANDTALARIASAITPP